MSNDDGKHPEDSVSRILLANHRRFLAFLEARVGNRHDAEEILQTAFVRSLQNSDSIRDSENAVAWFYRLLRNAVVDYYRRDAVSHRSLATYAEQVSDDGTADPATERTICECIRELVPTLKPEYGDLIASVDLNGKDVGAVAHSLRITPGNARVRLHRARAALKEAVERTCRTCATHGCVDCTCSKMDAPAKNAE